ncbi:MGMT family protein [Paenibacillus filicis]|uniref:MGMT family protein n=1 Tax=Paenibacillus filicis TaxID=669464 RepID=A0ABU9DX69_9BACL
MQPFTERVIHLIQQIPGGKIMTYGQIAALAGSPRGARQVVRILHTYSRSYQLPWHRVMNSKGRISLPPGDGGELQRLNLEAEDVTPQADGSYDLEKYLHSYSPDEYP